MKYFPVFVFIMMISVGCGAGNREKELQAREDSLNRKEQELLVREKNLEIREQQLAQIPADTSIARSDTLNPAVFGMWSVKMTCTETTCDGSAVGDTKTEQWELSSDAGKVVAKAMDGKTPIRNYSGTYNGNTLELQHVRPGEGGQQEIKMTVRLRVMDGSIVDGQREILRGNDCKVVYALQLEKM